MIEIIAGTNRPGANALRVARHIESIYKEHGTVVRLLSLGDMPQEIFNPTSYAEKPASFAPFQERILAADGLHVVTPEYNGSFPGVLKYFVDMLKFPESFERRPVAFVGEAAGIWGGFRSVEQLQVIFGYRNALLLPERVWIPGINDKLGADGRLNHEMTVKLLTDQCRKFAAFVEAVQPVRAGAPQPR